MPVCNSDILSGTRPGRCLSTCRVAPALGAEGLADRKTRTRAKPSLDGGAPSPHGVHVGYTPAASTDPDDTYSPRKTAVGVGDVSRRWVAPWQQRVTATDQAAPCWRIAAGPTPRAAQLPSVVVRAPDLC